MKGLLVGWWCGSGREPCVGSRPGLLSGERTAERDISTDRIQQCKEAAGDTMSLAASVGVLWRCPTLPQPIGCSTIGAAGLSFQVRNVAGRFPGAVTTTRLFVQHHPPPCLFAVVRRLVGVWVDRGLYSGCGCFASLLFCYPHVLCGWLFSVGPLVPVGSRAPCGASTSGLSTR